MVKMVKKETCGLMKILNENSQRHKLKESQRYEIVLVKMNRNLCGDL